MKQGLARSLQSNKLELHFRPEDPYSHPAFGELQPCNNFLLRITKKAVRNGQDAENTGRVATCLSEDEIHLNQKSCTESVKNDQHVDECQIDSITAPTEVKAQLPEEVQEDLSADIVARVSEACYFNDVAQRKKRNWADMEPQFEVWPYGCGSGGFDDSSASALLNKGRARESSGSEACSSNHGPELKTFERSWRYIEFYDAMSMPMAIALSGHLLFGQPLMVKPSKAEKNLVQTNASGGGSVVGSYIAVDRKLYVGNLHFSITVFQLRQETVVGVNETCYEVGDLRVTGIGLGKEEGMHRVLIQNNKRGSNSVTGCPTFDLEEHSVAAFTRVLDEASVVLFFRDKVYLHPDKRTSAGGLGTGSDIGLIARLQLRIHDKWRNMGISTAAHSSKEKIRIPRVKAITAGPLTNGQNSASASLIDDDKDGKTAPRWMHLDPCEGIYDNPLLYEKGWKKNLNYVIAFAKDGVYDVTKRYSGKWHEVLSRRNITTEPILSIILSNIRRECRQSFASQVISALEDQDRNEAEALERELHSKDDASISLPGRQSGDKEWRMSRSEFGSDEICFPSSSCCPARKCIDEHVTKIYNAFCPIISQFVEKSCSKSRAVEVLLFFKQMLINLKNSPFRTKRTSINPVSNGAQHLFLQMLPSFDQLFDALSLKSELDASGRVDIYLAADPVRTSIALPVLFHALDDVIHNVNMIYSGLVLASGEELPFGIVTSAFDGTRMSKWEEPNGARGEGCLSHQEVGNMQVPDLFRGNPWAKDRPKTLFEEWLAQQTPERIAKDITSKK
ncbi:unnamed protein product [Camellia sinensis]